MSVIRVNKTDNYTVMSNHHLQDKQMSLKAKGLLSQMLSLPDDWDYTIKGLVSINKESEAAISSALDELKKNGYLVINKIMPKDTASGRIEYVYDIFEVPCGEQKPEPKKAPKANKDADFEIFWTAYPKKKSKETARKAFEKAIKKTDLQTMLDAVEKQKTTSDWMDQNGQYIPYPATWLNAGAWEDEVKEEEVMPF